MTDLTTSDLKDFMLFQMGETNGKVVERVNKLRLSAKERGLKPEKIAELEENLMKIIDKRIARYLEEELGKIEVKDGTFHIIPSEKALERKKEQDKKHRAISEELHKRNEERVEEYLETLGK